jgi:hypothetical protein
VLATLAAFVLLPWPAAFALQARLSNESDVTVTADLARRPRQPALGFEYHGGVQFLFPLSGVPAGHVVACDAREVVIEGPDGLQWQSGTDTFRTSPTSDGQCPIGLLMPESFLVDVGDRSVTLSATLYLTLYGPESHSTLDVGEPAIMVPEMGLCHAIRGPQSIRVGCRNAFSNAAWIVAPRYITTSGGTWSGARGVSYSAIPAELRLQPVERFYQVLRDEGDVVTVATRVPVAHVHTTVEAHDVYLYDYAFGR